MKDVAAIRKEIQDKKAELKSLEEKMQSLRLKRFKEDVFPRFQQIAKKFNLQDNVYLSEDKVFPEHRSDIKLAYSGFSFRLFLVQDDPEISDQEIEKKLVRAIEKLKDFCNEKNKERLRAERNVRNLTKTCSLLEKKIQSIPE